MVLKKEFEKGGFACWTHSSGVCTTIVVPFNIRNPRGIAGQGNEMKVAVERVQVKI